MYTPIEGMMSAREAADALVMHAKNIAESIKRGDNVFFSNRATSLQSVLDLLGQYAAQDVNAWIEPSNRMPSLESGPRRFGTKVEVEVQCELGIERRNCFVGGSFDDDDLPGKRVLKWRPLNASESPLSTRKE